eukprot:CAMPEP_0167802020 /NCGR_PEP_ID=MMETSP0111_2-20121227/18842_1 /TAXON_ID=91324 /ORGANISM="Lotharella globosa, Strain CCCM811" /LENGTH=108 /DNA_ID=CAMNT_0007697919 /DNA_START=16 /DNA_END=343 /DNA_ORIENTATION=+
MSPYLTPSASKISLISFTRIFFISSFEIASALASAFGALQFGLFGQNLLKKRGAGQRGAWGGTPALLRATATCHGASPGEADEPREMPRKTLRGWGSGRALMTSEEQA